MEDIDDGVSELVAALRESGFETVDSGDGTSDAGCARDRPHVTISCVPDELVREARILREWCRHRGVEPSPVGKGDVWIHASFDPADGTATIDLVGVDDSSIREEP